MTLQQIKSDRAALVQAITDAGCEVVNGRVRCPFHVDRNPSGSLYQTDEGYWRFRCFPCDWSGDVVAILQKVHGESFKQVCQRLGVENGNGCVPLASSSVKPHGNGNVKPPKVYPTRELAIEAILKCPGLGNSTLAGEWVYQNEGGSESFRVLRFNKPDGSKEFRPLSPVEGGWVVKRPLGQLPIYNLEEVKNAKHDDIIYICEGEKACEAGRSIGLICTTSAGGSNGIQSTNWMPVKQSKAKLVCILPDNDEAGEKFSHNVAEILQTIGGAK